MDAGEYVPDEVTNLMVRNRIDEPDAEPGFLLDGYPRTLAQVEELDGMIKFTGHELDAVVVLTVDSEELIQRLLQRAETDGRSDDTEEVIRRRQEVYAEQTEPLIDVYRDRNLLIEVDGMGEVDEVVRAHLRGPPRGPRELTARRAQAGLIPMGFRDRGVEIKTPDQIAKMRVAGLLVGETLELLRSTVRAGVTTGELDRDRGGEHPRRRRACRPSSATASRPSPATICASVNDEVVHGIPGDRVLQDGDVISIDCGAIVDGWHGDSAITVAVGEVSADVLELMRVTEESMWAGIAAARLGGRVTDISHAVESYVRSQAHPTGGQYGILEEFTGHGIGTAMHQPPNVPNYGRPGRGPKLERGLALAVEPMVTLGSRHSDLAPDEWTVLTEDGSWAAHFEHTFTLTPDGAWVLTALDGGEAKLAELGVPYGGS